MVDFKKRLKNRTIIKKIDPIEIYDSLDRRSEAGPLRPSQAEILTNWYQNKVNEKNNIIKLHTGEGKTLVGLLMLQSKINSQEGPCLYICPNIYLSEQVCAEAEKFGIPYCLISSDNMLPDDFLLGSKILITHVQKVFNGKTIFGLKNKSADVGAIILDDSHACIDSIKSTLTIKVDKEHSLYKAILSIFSDDVREQGEGSFLEIESGDYNTMLPVPYWSWFEKKEETVRKILELKEDARIKFVWPLIKDQIENCQAFISGNTLEISPTLMPIEAFGVFSNAKNRILMSATTQDDSFFIKGLGFDVKAVSQPLICKDQKWSGEKMILIPSLIHDDLQSDTIVNWLAKTNNNNKHFGIVALIPSFSKSVQYKNIGATIANSSDIFDKVKELKDGKYAHTIVFANRYDGIDLPDNACRILIIDSMPFFDSLLDRYEENCRPSSDIINIRIAQKIEQGLGRSVRGEKDYSIIILVGGDLIKFIKSTTTNKYFSPQTKKQIEIGIQIAGFAKEDSDKTQPLNVLIELMNQSLQRDEAWKEYYVEEMEGIQNNKELCNIYNILDKEYKAECYFSSAQYDKACEVMQKLCDQFSNDNSERGWYLQQLARYKYRISKADANALQKSAFQSNLQLLKPIEGIVYSKLEYINENRISRIRKWVSQHKNYPDMMISLEGVFQDLSFGMPSEKFEAAMQILGESLGFLSQRPDKEIKKGPDNLWCGVENQFFLIECKNEVSDDRSEITKYEAGQMNSHAAWFESVYGQVNCKRILVIPTKNLSYHADFSHDVQIMRKGKLRLLKNNAKALFKEFSSYAIHDVSDEKIQMWLSTHKLGIEDLKSQYSEMYYRQKN